MIAKVKKIAVKILKKNLYLIVKIDLIFLEIRLILQSVPTKKIYMMDMFLQKKKNKKRKEEEKNIKINSNNNKIRVTINKLEIKQCLVNLKWNKESSCRK